MNTIFYLSDPSLAVSELWRVLTDGGTSVICFTSKKSLQNRRFARHGLTLIVPDEPPIGGALGAALLARDGQGGVMREV